VRMVTTDSRVLVTGGAGMVGSHLVDRLIETGNEVVVADNFETGRESWVNDEATVAEVDLTDRAAVFDCIDSEFDLICHFAALKQVREPDPRAQFEANTAMTYNVAEAAVDAGVENIAYTSSSTVYGEAPRPTPEDYPPIEPISVYGSSKVADESLLSTYGHTEDLTVWIFRFANIVGPRLRGAVIPDFIEKLRSDPETLKILGDGRQQKSYMHIEDCISAICHVITETNESVNTFNLGTRTTTSVTRIADIVSEELGVEPSYSYTGGDRGWEGDVPKMRLSIEKLSALGWSPDHSSDQAVRRAAGELAAELGADAPRVDAD